MFVADRPTEADQGVFVRTAYFDQWYETSAGLVLTPRCDIAMDKADFLLLCAVASPVSLAKAQRWTTRKTLGDGLRDVAHEKLLRFHWIDPLDGFPDGAVADFQLVASMARSVLDGAGIITGLDGPWREQVSQRYSAYVGRVGVETIPRETITERWRALFEKVLPQVEDSGGDDPTP